jgi:hypothetical protein
MPLQWNEYQKKIAEVILRHRSDAPSGYDLTGVQIDLPDVTKGKISKIATELRKNDWVIPGTGEPRQKEVEGGKLITVTAKKPAPVVFTIGDEKIEVAPGPLYQCWLFYLDLKSRCALEDEFTNVMLDGIGLLWKILLTEPVVVDGKIKMEVHDNGAGTGTSQEQTEAGQDKPAGGENV